LRRRRNHPENARPGWADKKTAGFDLPQTSRPKIWAILIVRVFVPQNHPLDFRMLSGAKISVISGTYRELSND